MRIHTLKKSVASAPSSCSQKIEKRNKAGMTVITHAREAASLSLPINAKHFLVHYANKVILETNYSEQNGRGIYFQAYDRAG